MSRFHFDENAADTAIAALKEIKGNIEDAAAPLSSLWYELYRYEGFNIFYAVDCVVDEKDNKFPACLDNIQNSINTLKSVKGTVRNYIRMATIDKKNNFTSIDNIDLRQKIAQYGHDPERTSSGLIDAVLDGLSLDLTKLYHTDEEEGLKKGLDKVLEGLGMSDSDDLYSKIYDEIIKGTFKYSSNLKKTIPELSNDIYCKLFFDIMDTISDVAELSNDVYAKIATKYFMVMEYLDTMADCYSDNSELLKIINECRETYIDKLQSFAMALSNCGGDFVVKELTKETISLLASGNKELMAKFKAVGFALSTANKAMGNDDLYSSFMILDGIESVRSSTKASYEAILEKINSGSYTHEDITNANNLFDIYKQSLIEEYEAMISIEKKKYENKVSWLNGSAWNPNYRKKALEQYNTIASEYNAKIEEIKKITNPIGAL